MNVLLTSVGRRVALLRAFQRAVADLGGKVVAADMSPLSSGYQLADERAIVPRCTDPGYVDRLLDICRQHEIRLLVPLIDTELGVLAAARDRFEAIGTIPVCGGPRTAAVSGDKVVTHDFFRAAGLPTPALIDVDAALAGDVAFPIFIKPIDGSSSIGSRRLDDSEELRFYWPRTRRPLLMEYVRGVEYTVDVYAGLSGRVRCAVPRRRIETRAGEVSKGLTENLPDVMNPAIAAAEALPDRRGVLTFQCIVPDGGGPAVFIELNARFGGGAPLSIAAGADFPRWLALEALGHEPDIGEPPFRDRTLMLRFDDAVFVSEDKRWI